MQIEGDGNRYLVSRDPAQALQQFAFPIVAKVGNHGAVEPKQYAIIAFGFCRGDDGVG